MAKLKTKFDSLVKLKKVKIDEVENELSKLNAKIQKAQNELQEIENEISTFTYPKEGNFALITQFKMLLKALLNQKNQKQQEINFLNNQKTILTKNLQEANLDYEKMKYLQADEIQKQVKKIKHQEAKDMDEIALMLYKG